MLTLERLAVLLLVAAVVAMVAQRFRLPYTVGLVAAGVGLALTGFGKDLALTRDLIYTAFLPPLLFEAAFYLRWSELRRDLLPILTLAFLGVLVSAGVTAVGMHLGAHWEWATAAVFGALIAATDPVSVIAIFKETGLHGRLRLLVEAESLLNDGVAAVVFASTLLWAQGGGVTAGGIVGGFALSAVGGILCGLTVGGLALLLAGKAEDHLVEITFTTVAAYGAFLLAEHVHVSGVLATITTGLLLGNVGQLGSFSDKGREAVASFWDYAAFVVNSLIFLLIGAQVARTAFAPLVLPTAIAIGVVLLSRAVSVYGICPLFWRSPLKVPLPEQHVLVWGGLRGALGLALVLGLPEHFPHRAELAVVTFGVVAFSIVVQGITVLPLLRRLHFTP